jgi:hypothetical protein
MFWGSLEGCVKSVVLKAVARKLDAKISIQ